MKLRNLFIGVIAAVFAFAACEKEVENLGDPNISISANEMTFAVEGGEQELTLNATREWKVETEADWVVVSPESGVASADDQVVTVSVLANEGMDRTADLKFTIGMKSQYLTVLQAGPGGSAEDLVIYYNDYDKEEATKTYGSSGGSWPYLDQFEGWKNQTGSGAANVEYAFSGMSARANSTSDSNYSDYEGSGKNNMFFGKSAYLATKNIALGGATGLTLTFGTEKYSQDNGSVFTKSEYHIYVSNDATKWVEITDYSFAGEGTEGRWNIATANFSVPEGTENLSLCIKVDVASSYRMDDFKLVKSEGGAAVDFTQGVEMDFNAGGSGSGSGGDSGSTEIPGGAGEGTEASPYNAAKAQNIAAQLGQDEKIAGVYVQGTVKEIKEVSTQYGNATYWITDDNGEAKFYVYRGKYVNDTKFTSEDQIKVGDKVVVYGELMNYMGNSPQLGQGNYLISINGSSEGEEGGGSGEGGDDSGETGAPAELVEVTIAQFLAAEEDDTWYKLTGEIVSIAKEEYGNFTIEDATGEVYIYGMTNGWVGSNDKSFSQIGLKVGDTVTLGTRRGSYNGTPQGGGTSVPAYYISHVEGGSGEGDSGEGDSGEGDSGEGDSDENVVTVAEFLAAEESTSVFYQVTGTVTVIESSSTEYHNMTLTITDETGSLYVYRMKAEDQNVEELGITVGDELTLKGNRGSYNGNPQMVNGLYVSHVDKEAPASDYDASITFSECGYANAQSVDGITIDIDSNVSCVFDKASANNAPAYYDSGSAIRMYQNGATLTVTAANGKKITKIELAFGSNMYYLDADSGTLSAESAIRTWEGDASSVKFTATGTDKNHRAYVASIKVAYQ